LGGLLTEDEISRVKTLRGFAALVATRLAPNDSAGSQAIELVKWTMEQLFSGFAAASLNLDVPLIDAINPRRWDQT
jgi:hypothetical protein